MPRDWSKYEFNGVPYLKGPLVNAVLKYYITQHPNKTFNGLKKDFPDEIQQGVHGVFKKYNMDEPKRFYTESNKVIHLQDAVIVTCTQWNFHNIFLFIQQARALGLKIEFYKLYEGQAIDILWHTSLNKDIEKALEYFENNNPSLAVGIIFHHNFPKKREEDFKNIIKNNKNLYPKIYQLIFLKN